MRRFALPTFALALAFVAAPAAGQGLYVMVGPSFPISDYGEYANVGIHAAGGVTFAVAEQVSLYGEAFWGQNSHDGDTDSKTNPYGFMAGGLFSFSDGNPVDPYVFGGAGLMWHKYTAGSDSFDEDGSESAFGFQLGGGLGFDLGGLEAFTEARFFSASFEAESPSLSDESTSFLSVAFGIVIDLGGDEN